MGYLRRLLYIIEKGKFIISGLLIFVLFFYILLSNREMIFRNTRFNNDNQVSDYLKKAKEDNCKANLLILQAAIDLYSMDYNVNENTIKKDQKIKDMHFLKEYLYKSEFPKCPSGGEYIIENRKVKCTVHGFRE